MAHPKPEVDLILDDQVYTFHNPLDRDVTVTYNSKDRIIKANDSVALPGNIAGIVAVQLVNEVIKEKYKFGQKILDENVRKEVFETIIKGNKPEKKEEKTETTEKHKNQSIEKKKEDDQTEAEEAGEDDAFADLDEDTEAEETGEDEESEVLTEEGLQNTHIGTLRKIASDKGVELDKSAKKSDIIDAILESK